MIGGHRIPVRKSISYLGVKLDTRRKFNEHVRTVAARAKSLAAALGRLIPNMS